MTRIKLSANAKRWTAACFAFGFVMNAFTVCWTLSGIGWNPSPGLGWASLAAFIIASVTALTAAGAPFADTVE